MEIIRIQKKIINGFILISIFLALTLVGSILQFMVVTENGGKMPVKTNNVIDSDKHFSYKNDIEIKKSILSDRFSLKLNKTITYYFSIGDVFLYLGFFGIITSSIFIIKYYKKLEKLSPESYCIPN